MLTDLMLVSKRKGVLYRHLKDKAKQEEDEEGEKREGTFNNIF